VNTRNPATRGRISGFDGAQLGTPIEAYQGNSRRLVHTMIKDTSRLPSGDPSKMSAIIIDSVNQDPAPKRIVLGSDACGIIQKALADRLAGGRGAEGSCYSRPTSSRTNQPGISRSVTRAFPRVKSARRVSVLRLVGTLTSASVVHRRLTGRFMNQTIGVAQVLTPVGTISLRFDRGSPIADLENSDTFN
jgi:hypothetical protein